MSSKTATVRGTLARIGERRQDLAQPLFDKLFAAHPEAKEMLGEEQIRAQQSRFTAALNTMIGRLDDRPWLTRTLRDVGVRNVDHGIADEIYDWMGEALIATLAEIAADEWNEEVERAWTETYAAASGLLRQGAAAQRAVVDALASPPRPRFATTIDDLD